MIRLALILSSIGVLTLASCAPGNDDKGEGGSPPIGFELAVATELDAREALGQTGSEIVAANDKLVELSVKQLTDKITQGNIRLIDVRRDDEVAAGMIPGAEHIALDQLDPAKLDQGDGREIVFYCRSGRRSAHAAEALAAHSGKTEQHLEGGILAWMEAGRPVATP